MDERQFEMAQKREQDERDARIAARVRYEGVSRADCIECGEAIPAARQAAIPGVECCVECQSGREVRR